MNIADVKAEKVKNKSKIAVVGVVVKNDKILLGKRHSTMKYLPDAWHLPGGFVEEGEALFTALKREIKEETNLDIHPIKKISNRFDHERGINILYILATVDRMDQLNAGSDLSQAEFVDFKDITSFCTPEVISNWPFDHKTFFKSKEELNSAFLEPTEYCNFEDNRIQRMANYFKEKHKGQPREQIREAYYLVRDTIIYELGNWNFTAAETLERKTGSCSNAANLLVALARACGIPAGFGVLQVKGQEYLGPISPPHLGDNFSKSSKHIYALVHLDGHWIKVDPSDDIFLCVNTRHFSPQCAVVEFDGYNDATLHLQPDHILSDKFPLTDIDSMLRKKLRKTIKPVVIVGNDILKFFRQNGYSFENADQGHLAFSKWLRRNKPHYYLIYKMYYLVAWNKKRKSNHSK